MLSKEVSSTIFESLVWLDLGLNPSLPSHWWTLYSLGKWLVFWTFWPQASSPWIGKDGYEKRYNNIQYFLVTGFINTWNFFLIFFSHLNEQLVIHWWFFFSHCYGFIPIAFKFIIVTKMLKTKHIKSTII